METTLALRTYSRKDLASIFESLPIEDKKWSITYLVNIVSSENKPLEVPTKKFKIKHADIETARKLMSFGENCDISAEVDVRDLLADKHFNNETSY